MMLMLLIDDDVVDDVDVVVVVDVDVEAPALHFSVNVVYVDVVVDSRSLIYPSGSQSISMKCTRHHFKDVTTYDIYSP